MRPSGRRRRSGRVPRFESVEPRLFLSGDAVADFHADYFVEDLLHDEVHAALADAHERTGLDSARAEYGFTGSGQTVVVIDSGIAYDHYALGGGLGSGYRVVGGFDFTAERDADPYDDGPFGSHGTHVAGILGSSDRTNPGVAPGVDLVGLRVFDDDGRGEFAWVEQALRWVHTHRSDFPNPITAVNLSLGASWNSGGVPGWATLEDELARLEADGIVITVAAGNSFTTDQQPGLTYPAVSPHVVPVASVDNNGLLSYFSQRDRRVIAAPGRSVRSTVPDYVGNRNGIDDDFARYSGTSMAAPYVAGASVLLRQAYEFVGVTDVSQDTLYNLMVNTADSVYDPVTAASYRRLNLDRALDAIMPADDFGSTAATAHSWGTITDTASLAGTIGSLTDQDWFRFTAGLSGSVTVQPAVTGDLAPQWRVVGAASATTDGVLSFDVVAGRTYSLGLATGDGLGHYTLEVNLEPVVTYVDWGTVRQERFDGNRVDAQGQWYTVTAANRGVLTVEAFFSHAEGNVDLKLFDAGHRLLRGSSRTGNYERIDVVAHAGDTFYVYAYARAGVNDEVDFRVTNLLARSGEAVHVWGTGGDDRFLFSTAATHRLRINGVLYQFATAEVNSIVFDGLAGSDTVVLHGTRGEDSAVLRPGWAELSGPGYRVRTIHAETVTVRSGGGSDRVVFYDSRGDDTFVAGPRLAKMFGNGFDHRAAGFSTVHALASGGGSDLAKLFDSAGNDTFVANSIGGRLFGEGFSNRVRFFDEIRGYAIAGGNDVAKLFDSAGNDTFVAGPNAGRLSGDGFLNQARFFEGLHAYATAGGKDVARLFDSAGNDTLVATPIHTALFGKGFYNRAKLFEEVYANGGAGGNDRAYLHDSEGDDRFRAAARRAVLCNDDVVTWLYGFEYVRASGVGGGTNHAEIAAVDYLLELGGAWS